MTGRLLAGIAASTATLAFASDAHAYRPFDGTDADVVSLGDFELELGPAHYYANERASYIIAPATVLNLGVLPRVELVVDFKDFVGLKSVAYESRARVLDTDVLLKWNYRQGILQGKSGLSMALEAGVLTPNVNGEDGWGASALFIESYRFEGSPLRTIHVDSQAQYTRVHDIDLFQSVILEGPDDNPVRPVAELFVEHAFGESVFFSRRNSAATAYSALVGAIWDARDDLAFDVGFRAAYEEARRAVEVRLGFTWSFELWSSGRDEGRGHARSLRRSPAIARR